jgi:hypothetical protein
MFKQYLYVQAKILEVLTTHTEKHTEIMEEVLLKYLYEKTDTQANYQTDRHTKQNDNIKTIRHSNKLNRQRD